MYAETTIENFSYLKRDKQLTNFVNNLQYTTVVGGPMVCSHKSLSQSVIKYIVDVIKLLEKVSVSMSTQAVVLACHLSEIDMIAWYHYLDIW